MNLRQALLHNTGWKIITMLFTFVNNIIIVRLLGAEGGAALFYAIAVFAFISTILRFGIENGLIYYATKYPERTGPLIGFTGIVTLLQVGIIFLLCRFFIGEANSFSLLWVIIFTAGNITMYYITSFYQVKRMYISINVLNAAITALQTCCFLYFYFGSNNFMLQYSFAKNINDAVLIVMSAGLLIQIILLCIWFFRQHAGDFKNNVPQKLHTREVFRYAGINFLGAVLFYLITRADFYFTEKYTSALSFGNYVQIAKIGQMALVLPGLLGGVIFPFSVSAGNAFAGKIAFFCRTLTAVFGGAYIFLLLFGDRLFVWLLGADFYLVGRGIIAAFPGIWCLALSLIFISYLEGLNKQKIIIVSNVITLLLITAGDALLVPGHGIMAAAAVFSVANFAGMLLLLFQFKKQTGTSLESIFLLNKNDLKVLRP